MEKAELYEKLRKHLDQGIMGGEVKPPPSVEEMFAARFKMAQEA